MFEKTLLRGFMLAVGLALLVALLPSLALAGQDNPPDAPDASAVGHRTITGNPLTIHVAEDTSIQVFYAGKPDGQVYPPGYDEADSGGFMWWGTPLAAPAVYGPYWAGHDLSSGNPVSPWWPIGQSLVTGSGTVADPWQVTTNVATGAQPAVDVHQWIRYVDGSSCFRVLYNVSNHVSPDPGPFTFFHAADLHPDDGNNGYGFHDSATGAVGAWNQDRTFLEFFVPVTSDLGFPMPPASHYQEADYKVIWNNIGDVTGTGPGFNDTIRTDWHNSGAGLQWDLAFPGGELPGGNFIEFVFDWCFLEQEEPEFVPEPGTVLLMASGLMGLAGYAGLRSRKS
jgi:hypothetical protein